MQAGLEDRAPEECSAVERSLVTLIDRAAVLMGIVDLTKKVRCLLISITGVNKDSLVCDCKEPVAWAICQSCASTQS